MKKTQLIIMLLMALTTLFSQSNPQLGKASIDEIIKAMTIEEKVLLLVGAAGKAENVTAVIGKTKKLVPGAAGTTFPIERLGIPAIVLADGPAGLRIDPIREGTEQNFYCTHFPVATLLASTWNTDLVYKVGAAIGTEVYDYGVDVLLAPATNIHRNPLNGRNFEYYSEDPLLSGKICASMVNGVQSKGVGTSVKHYALNNQETNRGRNDVRINLRALREIYLKPFEIAVKESQPWTIMTSYNKLNGVFTSERADLVTSVLRDEWGFAGLVMTDWFGGINAPEQIEAGNDMLQPGYDAQREALTKAIKNGTLSLRVVDEDVKRILELIVKTPRFKGFTTENKTDLANHAITARNAATEGMVLLKNESETLPIINKKNVAVFGVTSYDFIAGGTGSGDVNRAYTVSMIQGLTNAGFVINKNLQNEYEDYMSAEARKLPKRDWWMPKDRIPEKELSKETISKLSISEEFAIVTIGKTSGEGTDRKVAGEFTLKAEEQKLIEQVCAEFHKQKKKVVVILNICGVIETSSWKESPDAILISWLAGQEGGNAVADVLVGKVNPSGKLTMTFPIKYEDVPSLKDFPKCDDYTYEELRDMMWGKHKDDQPARKNVEYTDYSEGIYVGYRYYDTYKKNVSYPFGYGKSYTTFEYSDLNIQQNGKDIVVTAKITNTGKYIGKEVAQLYIAAPGKSMRKPAHELKGFAKTKTLNPGETEVVKLSLTTADLASFNESSLAWETESGVYLVSLGASSQELKLNKTLQILQPLTIQKVNGYMAPESRIIELRDKED